jgi:outer membrane protein OmpA-like peptidoglycan-associated protein
LYAVIHHIFLTFAAEKISFTKKNKIMKTKIISLLLCVGMLFACNNTQKGAGIGAGGGAVLGGIIGAIAGNTAIGAAIGGAVGAGAGAIIGNRMDKAKKQAQQIEGAKVETVKDTNGMDAVKTTFDEKGIYFATGKSDLDANAKSTLQEVANWVKNNPDTYIAIIGHTDSTGSDAVNNPLSQNRALSVKNYLRQCGVNAAQIQRTEGQGSKNPVADNSTAEGRQQNRRVEFYMYASEQMIKSAQQQAN